ncbi:MAG: glycosyltransferase family 39 protein, partial [Planctomycetes bacterium]|nr:glycosyltransferase family 39 protein [Planctomycetota bacterium]
MGEYLEGWDDVDFAFALHDYDITRYQPQFPGYPVYIFFCWLVSRVFSNDALALTLPGAIFGALTIMPLYSLAKEMFSREVAVVTALLFIVNPLCWLQSEKPTSDSMGLFFLMLSAQLLFSGLKPKRYSMAYFVTGGIVFALTLGIRLAYFPFIAIWVFALIHICRQKGRVTAICSGVASLAFGISLWLIPMIHHVKFTNLLGNALSFTYGHFTDWGGAVGTVSSGVGAVRELPLRLLAFLWCLLCNGLGFWWHDTSGTRLIPSVIILMAGVKTLTQSLRLNQQSIFVLLYMIPYSVWVLFCQNLEKPRHVLPLVPILLICLSYGLVRISPSLLNLPFIPSLRRRGL